MGIYRFKIASNVFESHLEYLCQAGYVSASIEQWKEVGGCPQGHVLLTFDDGGLSAYETVFPLLDKFGFVGHFFIVTDDIDRPGFLSKEMIRELADTGHVIGSHSCSHPELIYVDHISLKNEMVQSKIILESILGRACSAFSIPTGEMNRSVVMAALDAGYQYVFSSTPGYLRNYLPGSLISRWAVRSDVDDSLIWLKKVISKDPFLLCKISLRWKLVRIMRIVLGGSFYRIRDRIIRDNANESVR